MAQSGWVTDDVMRLILAAMMPDNRRAVQLSLATGLRISDSLSLPTEKLRKTARPYVRDSKTGKLHRIYVPQELRAELLANAGPVWVFPGRLDRSKHRTRQAVYKDMMQAVATVKRAGWADKDAHISPHSARKMAAVKTYHEKGFAAAQDLLVHDVGHPAVTMVYAMADQFSRPSSSRRSKRSCAKSTRKPQKGQ